MIFRSKGAYYREARQAWKRCNRLKLVSRKPDYTTKRYLTDESLSKLVLAIFHKFGALGPKDVVQQCFGLHLLLIELVKEVIGCDVYYTLGCVELEKGKPLVFHQTESQMKQLLSSGLSGRELNLHAWLTLPSMEILDFSLPTSLHTILDWSEIEPGSVVSGHADELVGALKYHPLLLGEDFLRKTGALIEFRALQVKF